MARLWSRLPSSGGRRHLGPLAILTALHLAVVERALRGGHGIPSDVIPWDFADSYARFLTFISDSLRAGSLPIWFPYGHAGTPFLVNPQSQLWTPVTWVLSLVPGYSLLVAQWQVFFTVLFGSVGVYFLANSLWGKRSAALLSAIAFNFTSARLCNAEHMDIITAFSLFPWIFLGLRRLGLGKPWATPVLGMLIGLLVVSGYPGVVLLCPLWFGAWSIWILATDCPDRASRKRFVVQLCLALALGVGISAGYWLPVVGNLGAFSRGAPLTTNAALAQGLPPSDLWHLIFGAPTSLIPHGEIPDKSMRGLYFGIVALLLAVYALVGVRDRTVTALGVGLLVALLMSLGKGFFLRVALHDYLPFLNLSRFPPADSRAVAALAGSLLAGGGLANLLDHPEERPRLARILGGGVVLLLVGLIWLEGIIYPKAIASAMSDSFGNAVFIELLAVAVAIIGVLRFVRPQSLAICLLVASGFDAGTHATLESRMWSEPSSSNIYRLGEIWRRTFDSSSALQPRADAKAVIDVASNDAYLDKKFYLGSYSPFLLRRFESLLARNFHDFFINGKRVVGFVDATAPSDGAQFESTAVPVDFAITRYLPDRVDYAVNLPARTTLVFNEVYFPGWHARVDNGASVSMREVSGGLRALTVDAGHHTISTRFSPWTFWLGLVTTLLSWGLALAWLVRTTVWPRRTVRA